MLYRFQDWGGGRSELSDILVIWDIEKVEEKADFSTIF